MFCWLSTTTWPTQSSIARLMIYQELDSNSPEKEAEQEEVIGEVPVEDAESQWRRTVQEGAIAVRNGC